MTRPILIIVLISAMSVSCGGSSAEPVQPAEVMSNVVTPVTEGFEPADSSTTVLDSRPPAVEAPVSSQTTLLSEEESQSDNDVNNSTTTIPSVTSLPINPPTSAPLPSENDDDFFTEEPGDSNGDFRTEEPNSA
jgi:hypothetical protein